MTKLLFAILLPAVVAGCSAQGTSTGNPMVALSFGPYGSAPPGVSSQNVASAPKEFLSAEVMSISSLKLCFKRLRFKQDGENTNVDPTVDSDNIDFEPGELTIDEMGTYLGEVQLPVGSYSRVEFDLEDNCSSGKSVQVTNANGPFSTQDRITIKFEGNFVHSEDTSLALDLQPIVTALMSVSNDSEIRTQSESASGSY